jgi:hypothetical protein
VGSARAIVAVALVSGCGRFNFDPLGLEGPDASCTWSAWSNVAAQTALNGASDEWEPALSPDGLALVYVSYTGSPGMYVALRATTDVAFGAPRMIAELSTSNVEHGPMWSSDGQTLYFSRELTTSQPMSAAYLGNGMFANPVNVALPSSGYAFALSSDALEVFMTEDVAGELDLRHATRASEAAAWVVDATVDSFDRAGTAQGFPALDEPRNDLYFRDDTNIVVAHRAQRDAPFGPAQLAPGLAVSGAITGDPSLTADGLTLAFASTRGGTTASDIFLATRTCD